MQRDVKGSNKAYEQTLVMKTSCSRAQDCYDVSALQQKATESEVETVD